MSQPKPFTNDGDYLDAEIAWLAVRARRLGTERRLRERALDNGAKDDCTIGDPAQVLDDELTRQVTSLREREATMRGEIDVRLAATRESRGDRMLGLDNLCATHGLGPEERIVVLLGVASAIGNETGMMVAGAVEGSFYTTVSVETCSVMAGAVGVGDRVRLRRLFSPEANLLKSGIFTCSFNGRARSADDLPEARLHLTEQAFNVIVGSCDPTQVQ